MGRVLGQFNYSSSVIFNVQENKFNFWIWSASVELIENKVLHIGLFNYFSVILFFFNPIHLFQLFHWIIFCHLFIGLKNTWNIFFMGVLHFQNENCNETKNNFAQEFSEISEFFASFPSIFKRRRLIFF